MLIEGPGQWTREAYARDRHSKVVPVRSDRAARFCAAGAVKRAEWDIHGSAAWTEVDPLYPLEQPLGVTFAAVRVVIALDQLAAGLLAELSAATCLLHLDGRQIDVRARPCRVDRLYESADALNDERALSQREVLRAFDRAVQSVDRLIANPPNAPRSGQSRRDKRDKP